MTIPAGTTTVAPEAALPYLTGAPFITDGGLETTLVFQEGIDLPAFAAFPLLAADDGRAALTRYYAAYQDVAARHDAGIVLDTPTWRANPDWAARLDWTLEELSSVNRAAIDYLRELADRRPETPAVFNGVIGPRGDGYEVGDAMSADAAKNYHALQARAFADAGADLVTAVTMTYADEAIGIVRAVDEAGLPVAIGFTVETDGRLPSGQRLRDAIEQVDAATGGAAAYLMVNCAHPDHFVDEFANEGPWLHRIKAIRANASRMSHAELDEAEQLDRGNPAELADEYVRLATMLPGLSLVGGCCGTDHEHIAHISAALDATR